MRPPRRRPPWWPEGETWPPERWPPHAGHGGPAWGIGWGAGRHGGALAVGMAVRAFGFLLLSIALVTLLGYVGAAIVGIATAPVGAVLVGLAGIVVLVIAVRLAWRALPAGAAPG